MNSELLNRVDFEINDQAVAVGSTFPFKYFGTSCKYADICTCSTCMQIKTSLCGEIKVRWSCFLSAKQRVSAQVVRQTCQYFPPRAPEPKRRMLYAHSHLGPVAQLRLLLRRENACFRFKGCFSLSFIIMHINDALQMCHGITNL